MGVANPGAANGLSSRGNRVAMLGDSITSTAIPSDAGANWAPSIPLAWAHLLSDAKMISDRAAGISGNTTAQMLARAQSDIIAPATCDWCVILGGTNDAGGGVVLTGAGGYAANIQAIVAALRSANIRPVLCTVPPQPAGNVNYGGNSTSRRKVADIYNVWLRAYAFRNGIPLADLSGLYDPATGAYLAQYDSGDGIHPSGAGAKLLGQAIADAITPLLNPLIPQLPTHSAAADVFNLLPNALFLTDTNADGVPDSYTKTGNGAASLVTGDATIKGSWLRLVDTVNETTKVELAAGINAGAAWAAGDKLALSGRVQIDGTAGNHSIYAFTAGSNVNNRPLSSFNNPLPAHRFYMEFNAPAGSTVMTAGFQIAAGTGLDMRIAQLSLVNLTQLGIA